MTGYVDAAMARVWIESFVAEFETRSAELTELDRLAGDGDFGTNLLVPLERVRATFAERPPATAGEAFATLSSVLMRAGGTSGPLLGAFFRAIARAAGTGGHEPGTDGISLAELAAGVNAGTATVQRLGGAQVGDCTMVDAMAPAAQALDASVERGGALLASLDGAALAARSGAESTTALVARRGRASYVGELGRGVRDPGAVAIAIFFESAPRAGPEVREAANR